MVAFLRSDHKKLTQLHRQLVFVAAAGKLVELAGMDGLGTFFEVT